MFSYWNSEVWSISVNNFEWCVPCGAGNSRVEYKFSKEEPFYPFILTLWDKEPKEFLYFLIFAFDFVIAFRMVGSCKSGFDAEALVKCSHVPDCKLGSTIWEDFLQEIV